MWFSKVAICLCGIFFATVCGAECLSFANLSDRISPRVQNSQAEDKRTYSYIGGPYTTLYVSCYENVPSIAVTWDGPTPDATFYDLVGTAGNLLTQRPASEVVKYSKQCRQEALKDDSEIATIEREGMVIECQAFKRDGGGTTITIFTE